MSPIQSKTTPIYTVHEPRATLLINGKRTGGGTRSFVDGERTGVPLFPSFTISQALSKTFSIIDQSYGYERATSGLILVPCSLTSRIFSPSYNNTPDFLVSLLKAQRTKIKQGQSFLSTWYAIWCGETRICLLLLTFNSTVKSLPFSVNPSRSGTPCVAQDSILIQRYFGRFFLT